MRRSLHCLRNWDCPCISIPPIGDVVRLVQGLCLILCPLSIESRSRWYQWDHEQIGCTESENQHHSKSSQSVAR
jgi:hypothetical protein